MSTPRRRPSNFPFPFALMAVDFVALLLLGISFAELFPQHGLPLDLIPQPLLWPVFIGSMVVAAACAYLQLRIVFRHGPGDMGESLPPR